MSVGEKMKDNKLKLRIIYAAVFIVIFIIEVLIALFVKDNFIRPYGGDILVTILICCFVRIFVPGKLKLLPVWVFLFAFAVEIGQYFDYVSLLGLGNSEFFCIVLGTGFSLIDVLCYATGCVIFFMGEKILRRL